jgi:hypothetical protein
MSIENVVVLYLEIGLDTVLVAICAKIKPDPLPE